MKKAKLIEIMERKKSNNERGSSTVALEVVELKYTV